jgi:hypothetical protein
MGKGTYLVGQPAAMHIGTSDAWDRLYTQAFGHIVYPARSGVFVYCTRAVPSIIQPEGTQVSR